MFPIYSTKNAFPLDQEEELRPDMYKFCFVWLKGQHFRHTRERAGGWWKEKTNNKQVP